MTDWSIFHDPECSNSRAALKLLRDNGVEPRVVQYRKKVPSEQEMELLLQKLGIKAEALVRTKEPLFQEKWKGLKLNEHEWVRAMREHPELIQRPIVVKDHKAVIGRPLENVQELMESK